MPERPWSRLVGWIGAIGSALALAAAPLDGATHGAVRSIAGDRAGVALDAGSAARSGERADIFIPTSAGARLLVARGTVENGGAGGELIQVRLDRGAYDVAPGMSVAISAAPAQSDLEAELGFLDAGAVTTASFASGQYLGCFSDTSDFDLDGHLERGPANTPQRCIAKCRELGFAFAAVQYGESCLCGESYGRYGPAANCDYACTGDASQRCGGYNANSVYATGLGGSAPERHLR